MTDDDPRSVSSLDYPGPPLPILMLQRSKEQPSRDWLVALCVALAVLAAVGWAR